MGSAAAFPCRFYGAGPGCGMNLAIDMLRLMALSIQRDARPAFDIAR